MSLVEEAIVAERGDVTWESLLDTSGLGGAYTSPGNVPDDDFERLVAARYPHYFGSAHCAARVAVEGG